MKILHIIDSGGFYGAEAMLTELCLEQRRRGIDAQVLSIGNLGNYEKPVEIRLREENVPLHIWRTPPIPNFLGALYWSRWARRSGFKVMHSHGYKGNILFGYLPSCLRRLPLVSTAHGWMNHPGLSKLRLYEWLDQKVLHRLDGVVLVNPLMGDRPEIRKITPSKRYVIVNGLSRERPAPASGIVRKIRAFGEGHFLIGCIGRLSTEKGFDILIRALHLVRKKGLSARLLIIGDGGQKSRLEELVSQLNLADDVLFLGYIENAGAYCPNFDVFVNCSYTEGLPITILEAMRCQCPLVVSDIPTLRYLTNNGELGFVAKKGSDYSFAEKLIQASDSHKSKALAVRAQQKFNQMYTNDSMYSSYQRLYLTLICRNG